MFVNFIQPMVSSPLMGNSVSVGGAIHQPWQRALQLFYAGLFAFVLPFTCWGAYATPGHPHAGAHLVFLAPPQPVHAVPVAEGAGAMGQLLARLGYPSLCTGHGVGAPQVAETQLPAGRSLPALLVISLLAPITLSLQLLPARPDRPHFSAWFAPLRFRALALAIPTPPPRSETA